MYGRTTLLLAAMLLSGACGANRQRFHFEPAPASFRVEHEDGQVWVRGLASIAEGRREEDGSTRIIVRILLENSGSEAARLDQARLVGSGIEVFGAPVIAGSTLVEPDGVLSTENFESPVIGEATVPPGMEGRIELRFPYPEGASLDLPDVTGLHLRLFLVGETREAEVEVSFSRAFLIPDPEPSVRWNFGFGYHG